MASPNPNDDRAVITHRNADLGVSLILFVAAIVLGWTNWQSGAGWAPDGPQAGYFPFYLCVILALASGYGAVKTLMSRPDGVAFVEWGQFKRVLQVAVPAVAFVAGIQWLGIYVSSFLLIAGFMRILGKSSIWASLLTAAIFVAALFFVFEIEFTVLLPKGPLERAILY